MAELTDEQKAKLIADTDVKDGSEVNKPEEPVEASEEETTPESEEEEKPTEEEEGQEPDSQEPATFTKRFSNFKGDTWETYGLELEEAYDNLFKLGLNQKKELDDARAALARLPDPTKAPTEDNKDKPLELPNEVKQGLSYIQTMQRRDMDSAFDKFKKDFPEVLDQTNFEKFQKVATPVGSAFMAEFGREPTYDELFNKMANYLGWTAANDEGEAGQRLRESLGSGAPATQQSKGRTPNSKVTDKQVDAYLKMYPSAKPEDVRKQLEEAIA